MATGDLVTLTQATTALTVGGFTTAPNWPAWQAWLPTAITAASRAAERYAQRIFTLTTFDEVRSPRQGQWDENEPDVEPLQNLPVVKITSVRGGRTSAILIGNTDAVTNQDATVTVETTGDPEQQVWLTGLTLSRTASGTTTTQAYPLFATPTLTGFSVIASGTGGTIPAGNYLVSYSLLNGQGESLRSADVSVNVGAGQTLTITLPTLPPAATSGANLYVSSTNGARSSETLQANGASAAAVTLSALVSGSAPPSSTPVTVNDLATAINGLGGGWTASVQSGLGLWGIAALYGPAGPCGALVNAPGGETRGASLDIFPTALNGWDVDQGTGTLFLTPQSGYALGGPGAPYQWPMSTIDYPQGGFRYQVRVGYIAGFATIPFGVQQAVCEILKAMFERLTTDTTLRSETAGTDTIAAFAASTLESLPAAARQLLDSYKVYRA